MWENDVTQKTKNSPQRTKLMLGAIIVVALVAAVIFVVLSSQSSFSEVTTDYSAIPQSRQADGGFVLGDPDAPLTVVAFEDFLCPACQRYKPTVEKYIEAYVMTGKARFEYRMLPVVHHPGNSTQAARLAECADTLRPNSFWNAHDAMFQIASARAYNDSSSRSFAEMMDMSYNDLLECTQDANQVEIDLRLAQQHSVTGTPTVFVRYGDGPLQVSRFGQHPTFEQLGTLVAEAEFARR